MNRYVDETIKLAFSAKTLTAEQIRFIKEGYSAENAKELLRVATKKKVLPVVGKLLGGIDVDAIVWEEKYQQFKLRNQQITRLMAEIFQAFEQAGVQRICVFENYGAMLAAGTDIGLYASGDVDLYALPEQKDDIIRVLAGFGYMPAGDELDRRCIMTEFIRQDGIIRINVAWKPLRRFSLPVRVNTAKYFDWERMGYYQDTAIRVPGPETLLYLCFLRIAVHGYSRSPDIRLYIDTYNATYNQPD